MPVQRSDPDNCLALLREILLRHTGCRSGTVSCAVTGLQYHCLISGQDRAPTLYEPVIILVVQGSKSISVGGRVIDYGPGSCFVCGLDMPAESWVLEASPEKPYLALSLSLETDRIAELSAAVQPSGKARETGLCVTAQQADPELLDAFARLADLAEHPEQCPVLEQGLLREIAYRLLFSPCGESLRSLASPGTQAHGIALAVAWLRENFRSEMNLPELAARSGMAVSTFHKYFKKITALSPLQFQKRLRLDEARKLMLLRGSDVTQAALAVGYESTTQFIREYKRLFGEPPRTNIRRLQNSQ